MSETVELTPSVPSRRKREDEMRINCLSSARVFLILGSLGSVIGCHQDNSKATVEEASVVAPTSSSTNAVGRRDPSVPKSATQRTRTSQPTSADRKSRVTSQDICGTWLEAEDDVGLARRWTFSDGGSFQMEEAKRRRIGRGWEARGTWRIHDNLVTLTGRLEIPDTALTARGFTEAFLVRDASSMMRLVNNGALRKSNE